MRPPRASGVVLLCALLLSACTSGSGDTPSSPTPAADHSSAAPPARTAPPVPPAPPRNGCYRLRFDELTLPTNGSEPVPCRSRHNTQTIFVGRLDTIRDGHLLAVDSAAAQKQLASTCPRKLRDFVGGNGAARRLSRFKVVWFSPTVEQSDLGANWFRCDLVALSSSERLADLPRGSRLRGAVDTAAGLDRFGMCGTAAPGTKGFTRVICSRRHSWRAISTIAIPGGKKYPGVPAVRGAGADSCRDQVREALGFSVRFSYGWEWPRRRQWEAGQHYGFCWSPD